jgi:hypothetical protein
MEEMDLKVLPVENVKIVHQELRERKVWQVCPVKVGSLAREEMTDPQAVPETVEKMGFQDYPEELVHQALRDRLVEMVRLVLREIGAMDFQVRRVKKETKVCQD